MITQEAAIRLAIAELERRGAFPQAPVWCDLVQESDRSEEHYSMAFAGPSGFDPAEFFAHVYLDGRVEIPLSF